MHDPAASGDALERTVHENLEALSAHRKRFDARRTVHDRIADRVTAFAGTMRSVYVHAVLFAGWLLWNVIPGLPHFDPFPFVMLAVLASVEAIFLSTFVLVTQNRNAQLAERRAELDVQVNLLSEREITRVLSVVLAIARKLEVREHPPDVAELQRDVHPSEILDRIDATQKPSEDRS